MIKRSWKKRICAQVAVEYLVLLGVITAVVLIGFNRFLSITEEVSNEIVNQTLKGIMGTNAELKSRVNRGRSDYP